MSRCLSLAIPSHTLGQHQQRLRLEKKKRAVAGGSGKKVGFALCGCFQVLIMVAQTLHACVCVRIAVGFHVYKRAYLCVGE